MSATCAVRAQSLSRAGVARRMTVRCVNSSGSVWGFNPRCQAAPAHVQVQRQARRALLASVLAVPVAVATRPVSASEEKEAELGEVKDLDIRALVLSTILMGIAGFTAVGAASTPDSGHSDHH